MSRVAQIACDDYRNSDAATRRALDLLGGPEKFLTPGEPLLLKPNMLAPHLPHLAVTTHPAMVEAALKIALDCGAKPVVADSPGLSGVKRVARVCGIEEVCKRLGVPLLDLGHSGVVKVSATTYKNLELAEAAVNATHIWNLPKWKTHTMMGLTLGVKNLYGCIPGKRKVAGHFRVGKDFDAFALMILDIWEVLTPSLTILDGVVAMDGPGPSRGSPVERNLILASSDAPALDWVACKLSGFSHRTVPTVKHSLARGLFDPKEVVVVGDEAKPMKFRPAPGSPIDFAVIPRPVRAMLRSTLSPAPSFSIEECEGCHVCVKACPVDVLTRTTPPKVNKRDCIRCYCCQELCPHGAVSVPAFRKKLGAPAKALRSVIKATGKLRRKRQG
jgi:uncharacterized protein (DUF362 family)/NAD-dependent dihydropyrimidine dehydrogenase PreA subunit